MVNKVKLPKEVAKAIETMHMADISDYGIVVMTISEAHCPDHMKTTSVQKSIDILRRFTFSNMEDEDLEWRVGCEVPGTDKLLQALVNGYEVESSPEDKVKELYQSALLGSRASDVKGDQASIQFHRGKTAAIPQVLDILNIKIEGVNA